VFSHVGDRGSDIRRKKECAGGDGVAGVDISGCDIALEGSEAVSKLDLRRG